VPTTRVPITIAQPSDLISIYDVRLAAKKTIVPGATDAHGTAVESVVAVTATRTDAIIRVVT
jgi:hypothetical protein